MTKEEILAMKVGTELDLIVHTKVMGKRAPSVFYPLPYYSTDISVAWRVVEKLVITNMFELRKIYSNTRWEAAFEGNFAEGDTAQEAICKAALLIKLEK